MTNAQLQSDPELMEVSEPTTPGVEPTHRKGLSMHEDVPVWYDCCSCEAEPYWVEALGEPPGGEASPESTE